MVSFVDNMMPIHTFDLGQFHIAYYKFFPEGEPMELLQKLISRHLVIARLVKESY